MVLMLYVKTRVTGKDIISEYRIHVYADHLSFEVSGLFYRRDEDMRLKLIKVSKEYQKQIIEKLMHQVEVQLLLQIRLMKLVTVNMNIVLIEQAEI